MHTPRPVHCDAMVRSGSSLETEPGELSGVDREIIRLLQRDGRMSFVDLANVVGATEKTVRKRVGELRQKRFIEITTVADPYVLGYRSMALLGIRTDGKRTRSAVAEDLFEVPSVDYAVVTTGRFDLLAEVLHRDDTELGETLDRCIRTREAVTDMEVFPYLELFYQQPVWESAQVKAGAGGAGRRSPELDELDGQIVRELNEDGRVPFSHLATRLGVSESQIRKRYAKLSSTGTIRVLALTNPRSLGFRITAWLAIGACPGASVKQLADRLAAVSSIAYLAVCAGQFDVFAEVVCRDKGDLLRLIDEDIRPLPEVGRLESLLCHELYYRRVIPAF